MAQNDISFSEDMVYINETYISNIAYHSHHFNNTNHTLLAQYPLAYYTCSNVTSFETYFRSCTNEWNIINTLKLFTLPLFVVLGTIGNIMTYILLTRKTMPQSSMTFYMTSLMVINTVVLYMGCGIEWYSYVSQKIHLAHYADWSCKIFNFSFSVVRYSAWWILVAMIIDASFEIWYPVRAQYVCTTFTAKFFTIFIFVWLVSIHVHALWTYELNNDVCNLDVVRKDFETIVWPWICAVVSTYVPLLLVIILLMLLIFGICYFSAERDENSVSYRPFIYLTILMGFLFLTYAVPPIIMNFIDLSQPGWQSGQYRSDWDKLSKYILLQVIFSTMESFYSSVCFMFYFAVVPQLRQELNVLCRRCYCSQQEAIQELEHIRPSAHLLECKSTDGDPRSSTYV